MWVSDFRFPWVGKGNNPSTSRCPTILGSISTGLALALRFLLGRRNLSFTARWQFLSYLKAQGSHPMSRCTRLSTFFLEVGASLISLRMRFLSSYLSPFLAPS